MKAVDTSVAVAAFGEWHELNTLARRVLDRGAAVPAHALLETYSVLTAFPPPHRAAPEVVTRWMEDRFPSVLEPPTPDEHRLLIRALSGRARAGGAVYDALVATTAQRAGATLVTADRRASEVYELVGVTFEWLS